MTINMRQALEAFEGFHDGKIPLPDFTLDTEKITAIMINEVVPQDPNDGFYGMKTPPDYLKMTIPLFQKAGVQVGTAWDILEKGIYLTNAVKEPKTGYAIETSMIEAYVPVLAKELEQLPNLKVIMLMGDVAKKAFNSIAKQKTGKNVIPAISTYKLRSSAFFYGTIRVFPSYIMTGGNILIEKSKFEMASDDIKRMMEIIG